MTSEPSLGRRALLRGAVGGAIAGAAWVTPQIISQPAFASASCTTCSLVGGNLVLDGSAESYVPSLPNTTANPDYDPHSPCTDTTGSVAVPGSVWATQTTCAS